MILLLSNNVRVQYLRVGQDIRRWVFDVYDRKQVTSYGILNYHLQCPLFSRCYSLNLVVLLFSICHL